MTNPTLFEKIINRQIPAHIVYEDDTYIAILDIFPKKRGHTLLITKTVYPWVNDVPDFGGYFETVRKLGLAIQSALGAEYISYQTFGAEIPHAHIHIVPYYDKTDESWHRHTATNDELAEVADAIKLAL